MNKQYTVAYSKVVTVDNLVVSDATLNKHNCMYVCFLNFDYSRTAYTAFVV